MSRIAESYCSPTSDISVIHEAVSTQFCPLLKAPCDGGGNRYLSDLEIKGHQLQLLAPGVDRIRSSICSLDVGAEHKNWIVCPRRLLSFERNDLQDPHLEIKNRIYGLAGIARPFGVWKEVKLKIARDGLSFDYTFDYVISPMKSGNPIGAPVIVEVMTSSTSGGNKRERTTIQQCFEDLLLGRDHQGPGINYRQVWGRMISQFFVKSMVASQWGGRTFWVIQDSLLDYIEKSTGFSRAKFVSQDADEVNLMSVSFSKNGEPVSLTPRSIDLYAGPLGADLDSTFYSILATPMVPKLSELHRLLISKNPVAVVE